MSYSTRILRRIFIGDIHGCNDELQALLRKIKHNPIIDRLYFVGDLVAKGPKSNEVVDFVRTTPNAYCVLGNHDYQVLKCVEYLSILPPNVTIPNYPKCGEDPSWTPGHAEVAKTLSPENVSYLSKLPLYKEVHPNIILVHAGIVPSIKLEDQEPRLLMNIRNIVTEPTPLDNFPKIGKTRKMEGTTGRDVGVAWGKEWKGPQHVFYGHDAVRGLQLHDYCTGLDSGCCYGKRLTAAIVKTEMNDDEYKEFYENNNNNNNKQNLNIDTEDIDEDDEYEPDLQVYTPKSGCNLRIVQVKAKQMYTKPVIRLIDDQFPAL